MWERKLLLVGAAFSFFIHTAAIAYFSDRPIPISQPSFRSLEVTYAQLPPEEKREVPKEEIKPVEVVREFTPEQKIHIPERMNQGVELIEKRAPKLDKFAGKMHLDKKHIPKILPQEQGAKVTIPLLKSEKITNPRYLSYNQMIRQRIRQQAYRFVRDSAFKSGSVYLTFIVAESGEVQRILIIEEKTSASDYLRDIGYKSIEQANPFPPFPEDLNYPELTFNVIISFEVNETQ